MLVPPGLTFYDKRVIFEGRFEQVILQDDTRSKFAMQKQTTYERETFRHFLATKVPFFLCLCKFQALEVQQTCILQTSQTQ